MSVHETTGIRELTTQELDQVSGGLPCVVVAVFVYAGMGLVEAGLDALLDWLDW